ncbi:MAG TPA: pilus assembly protein PilM [Planctomycetes bacterium]|nr:pilus assembly protein PilM [Planctomycetota bacterium]
MKNNKSAAAQAARRRNIMLNLTHNKTRPIGLEMESNSIRMIQLAHTGENARVIAADEIQIGAGASADEQSRHEFAVSAIKEMLARGNFRGRSVVSSLSNSSLKIKSLRLDTSDADQIEQLITNDIAAQFGLDSDNDEIRYIIAGSVYHADEIKNEIIFLGADKESISQHIALLEEAGLKPLAIDAAPCALFRCFRSSLRRQEDQQLVSVFIEVGSLFTTVIISRGQQIAFVKQIPIGGRKLNEQVASKLDVDYDEAVVLRSKLRNTDTGTIETTTRQAIVDAMSFVIEELAREISLCFKYYAVTFRGNRPSEAVFAGTEAYESVLLEELKKHLDIEVKLAQPFRGFELAGTEFAAEQNASFCEWAVAVGLGVRGWDSPDNGSEKHERN